MLFKNIDITCTLQTEVVSYKKEIKKIVYNINCDIKLMSYFKIISIFIFSFACVLVIFLQKFDNYNFFLQNYFI